MVFGHEGANVEVGAKFDCAACVANGNKEAFQFQSSSVFVRWRFFF